MSSGGSLRSLCGAHVLERLGQLRAGGRLASLLQAHREGLVAGMTTVLRHRLSAARPLIRRGSLASVPSSGTSPRPSGTPGPGLYSTCHFIPMLCSNADRKQPARRGAGREPKARILAQWWRECQLPRLSSAAGLIQAAERRVVTWQHG